MKSFLLNTSLAATALVLFSGASMAWAEQPETIRLVVKKSNELTMSAATRQKDHNLFDVVEVNTDGLSVNEVISEISKSKKYSSVELDLIVRSPNAYPVQNTQQFVKSTQKGDPLTPNDPDFWYQKELFEDSAGNSSAANILSAWGLLGNALENPVDVVVLDSGFFESEDLVYASGTNFIDDRSANAFLETKKEGCTSHGLGVASVIGATANNELLMSGIAPKINVHAARVMDCGTGRLSDVAEAINAFVNNNMPIDAADYMGGKGIFNLSLGAYSSRCPSFMQEAIDNAVSEGWKVVVAAGNNGIDAANWIPSNCQNVITVGASTTEGTETDFTNFGKEIDVAALGVDVYALCKYDSGACYWEGTSFSAPIVTGILALAQKVRNLDQNMMERIVQATALEMDEGNCEYSGSGNCGFGLINAQGVVAAVSKLSEGPVSSIKHALGELESCDQQWHLDSFGSKLPLCSLYRVEFFGGFGLPGESFQLYRTLNGSDSAEPEFVAEFDNANALIEDIDSSTFKYAFKVCTESGCGEEFYDLDASNSLSPSVCDN